ncbi:putative helicase MOV-10 [Diorhabda sublineata]|uniref:putative helicase MOV-10 n=1 Tax=Diorhabda sublineata TaxID=1163346 RepID=UPI0024E16C10|nr:putative helicase MOV-10 [Diorhabda sublineata]
MTILSAVPKQINFSNRQLNEEQRIIVQNIMLPKNIPYIIFGPPGTGKTVTIVESVYQLWKNYPNSRILICAPSNAATNEVASRLIDTMPKSDMFRLLGSAYATEINQRVDLRDIVNIQRDGEFYMPSLDQLLKYRVVMTTIVTAARLVNGGVPNGHFTHVFIDESGYATETQTLIPIAGILSNVDNKGKLTGQIILAGDHRQLGPIIHSSFANHCGYGTSLLERLITTSELYSRNTIKNSYDSKCVSKLVKNYRSHETILKLPNELFYDKELIAVGNDFTNLFIGWKTLKNENFPIIFHHVEGVDQRDETSPSFFNIQEVERVVEYLSKLFSSKVKGMKITEKHVGVITPYRKQVEKLRIACSKRNWNSLLIGSVEQFQGKERVAIIVSTVRSKNAYKFEEIDQRCQLGFVKNPKRFNVVLTRAKALLIVIGNANVLKTDRNWSKFIEYCSENDSIAGKPFQ